MQLLGCFKMAKGRERSGKWYFKNENEVMREIGLKPAAGSGNGWVDKEDGQNDYVICQLKSTDKASYKINQLDLEKLEYNAMIANKIPMFMLQFLNKDTRYVMVAIEDVPNLAEYIKTGEVNINKGIDFGIDEGNLEELKPIKKKKIGSSLSARKKFFEEKEIQFEQRKWEK